MSKSKAIYLRVSSTKQDTASQEPDLNAWERSQVGVEVLRFSEKVSGRAAERHEWAKLYELIRKRKISELVVWRLDRLGRSASGLTKLFDELQEFGVNLVSLRDGIDLSTAAGRMMAGVLASVAQFETEIRQERIQAGIEAAKKKGKRWGGRQKGVRTKVTDQHIKLCHGMNSEGVPVAEIAKTLNLSKPTIYGILRSVAK